MNTKNLIVDCLQSHNWNRGFFEDNHRAGITAVNATIATWENARETLSAIGRFRRLADENKDLIQLAQSVSEIRAGHAQGRTSYLLGFQNSSSYEDDLDLVGIFASLGVRIVQLTYNSQNSLAGSCYEEVDSGLSFMGNEFIREMNRQGVLIDLSHVGEKTSFDVLKRSRRPVAITHANPAFAVKVRRSKSNELLKALADNGGVIGVAVEAGMLPQGLDTTLDSFCHMVAELVELIGIDHVGIGSDRFLGHGVEMYRWWLQGRWIHRIPEYFDLAPKGWQGETLGNTPWMSDWTGLAQVAAGLEKVGFSQHELRAVMGENWMRLFEATFTPDA